MSVRIAIMASNRRVALAIDLLSSQAHEQANMARAVHDEEMAAVWEAVHDELHKRARDVFPLYPADGWHEAQQAVKEWEKAQVRP